jgi:hypothetical protein
MFSKVSPQHPWLSKESVGRDFYFGAALICRPAAARRIPFDQDAFSHR